MALLPADRQECCRIGASGLTVGRAAAVTRARCAGAITILTWLGGCTVHDRGCFLGSDPVELARLQHDDGSVETFVLEAGRGVDVSLKVVTEYDRERAFLGLRVQELAAPVGSRSAGAASGLLVTGTYPDSPAAAGGVAVGDVLLSVGGERTRCRGHLHAIEATLRLPDPVTLQVLHAGKLLDRVARPRALRERIIDSQSIELERSGSACAQSGAVFRGIPAVWSRRILGDDSRGVVVAAVDVGSPAWLAGVRAGDLVEAVDGGPVPALSSLARLIEQRGRRAEAIELRVRRGGAAAHDARIELSDYRGALRVWVPGVCRIEGGSFHDAWSAGPFGVLAGGASRHVAGVGRESLTQRSWYALLGMVRMESCAAGDRLRLFWFLEFGA